MGIMDDETNCLEALLTRCVTRHPERQFTQASASVYSMSSKTRFPGIVCNGSTVW